VGAKEQRDRHVEYPSRDAILDFEDWVTPHIAAMAFLAARLVGPAARDDIVQEALARAWQKRATFDAARGTARGWLCAVVADQARKWRRRHRAVRALGVQLVAPPDDVGDRVDLERAVASLPPRMRLAVECFYFAELSIDETADVMRAAPGTVKSTLADARTRLRHLLEEVSR
jgi:RNA polymerase sigma-70 factor (ECF subfamily)